MKSDIYKPSSAKKRFAVVCGVIAIIAAFLLADAVFSTTVDLITANEVQHSFATYRYLIDYGVPCVAILMFALYCFCGFGRKGTGMLTISVILLAIFYIYMAYMKFPYNTSGGEAFNPGRAVPCFVFLLAGVLLALNAILQTTNSSARIVAKVFAVIISVLTVSMAITEPVSGDKVQAVIDAVAYSAASIAYVLFVLFAIPSHSLTDEEERWLNKEVNYSNIEAHMIGLNNLLELDRITYAEYNYIRKHLKKRLR